MKKQSIACAAVGMAMASSLCAQSLFDLAPDDTQTDSLPLRYTAGVNFGYDDNPTPLLGGDDDESFYGNAYIGATFLNNSPQTTFSFGAQIGVIHYFDNLDAPGVDVDDTSLTASLYANWTHRVSERLRFVSRNNLNYELEPDFSTGFQAQRQNGNYFRYSTDNAVGYRWSERFATYTGVRFEGITFDDIEGGDRSFLTFYNDFRYQLSDRTVATFSWRYSEVSGDGAVSDATNHFLLAGLEHRFNQQSTGVIRVGAQLRDVDGGDSNTSPYVEGSFRTQVNESFGFSAYVRYGVEDFQRSLVDLSGGGPGVFSLYEGSQTLRVGVTGDYELSQDLTLVGGINYAALSYEDLLTAGGQSSIDEELLNVFVGANYRLTDNVTLNARYNFEDFTSDAGREYDRNRFSIGASTTF